MDHTPQGEYRRGLQEELCHAITTGYLLKLIGSITNLLKSIGWSRSDQVHRGMQVDITVEKEQVGFRILEGEGCHKAG